MATELATAYVSLVPSIKGIQGEIAKGFAPAGAAADRAGKSSGKRFVGGISRSTAKLGGLLAAGFAAVKVKDFLGDAIGEARESQKVGALTQSIIKSTGGAAKVTAKQVANLAGSISAKAGVDDEVIQSGANLLLTFKNVRNEAGKGNKVFDQATRAAVDLSAAGFGSVGSSSKMLGKALNDPVKGITALSRAGVTFTAGQQEQIKAMVANGDALSAQKMILGEVQSQVGGAAAASATAGEKLAVSWSNFKETVGTALIPVLDRVMNVVRTQVIPALLALGPAVGRIRAYAAPVIAFFRSFITGSGQASGRLDQFKRTFSVVWTNIKAIFQSAISIVRSLWAAFGSDLVTYAKRSIGNVLQVARGLSNILGGIFKTIAAVLKGDWSGAWEGIKQIVRGGKDVVIGVVKQAWNLLKALFAVGKTALVALMRAAWAGVKSAVVNGISLTVSEVGKLPDRIRGSIPDALGILADIGRWIVEGLANGIRNSAGKVLDAVQHLAGLIPKKLAKALGVASPSKVMIALAKWIPAGVAKGILDGQPGVEKAVKEMSDRITKLSESLVKREADRIIEARRKANDKIRKWNANRAKDQKAKSLLPTITADDASKRAKGNLSGLLGELSKRNALVKAEGKLTKGLWANGTQSGTNALLAALNPSGKLLKDAKVKTATLADIAKAREDIAERLKSAKDLKAQLQDSYDSLSSSIAGGITGELNLSGLVADAQQRRDDAAQAVRDIQDKAMSENRALTEQEQYDVAKNQAAATKPLSFSDVSGAVKALAGRAKAFAGKLRALIAAGIPKGLVQEIAGLGSADGIVVADAILSGTAGEVADLGMDFSSLTSWAKSAGDAVAEEMFGAGIRAQEGIIAGLLADDAKLTAAADQLAKKLAKAIKKALKIKSPSRLFRDEVGVMLPRGIIAGIDKGQPALDASVRSMVSVPSLNPSGVGVLASAMAATDTKDRPIYTDAGHLIGVIREIANGEAQLVWATEDRKAGLEAMIG